MTLLAAAPQTVLADPISLGDLTVADAQAQNVDGCGTDFERHGGGDIYFDDYETAIIKLNRKIVRLTADHPEGPGDSAFVSSDGTITTRLHWTGKGNTNMRGLEPMCPLPESDGHDAPRLFDDFVPCLAA